MQNKKPIPIQTLNLEVRKESAPQPAQQNKIQVASGGFKIPQGVIEEKKRIFSSNQPSSQVNQPMPMQLSQLEIYQQMGLKPYKMEDSIKDKYNVIANQPLAESMFYNEQKKLVALERKEIVDRIEKYELYQEQAPEAKQEQMSMIQQEIDKHYQRLSLLEEQFMNEEMADSYQPDHTVWEKIKQLREYRNNLKKEQLQAKKEYEEERKKQQKQVEVKVTVTEPQPKKKDEFIQQQIEQMMREKEKNKNRPRSKQKFEAKITNPEEQIYRHQFEEYKKDKDLHRQFEQKAKELQPKEFERIKLKQNQSSLSPRMEKQIIGDRAVMQVSTVEELHKLQLKVFSQEQLDNLDPGSKQALYKSILNSRLVERNHENEKNEHFVLQYSFRQIDKDDVGYVSKGEVLEFLLTNKDIQVIFELEIASVQPELDKYPTQRRDMMNFQEFSSLVKKLHHQRKQFIEKLKQDSKLFEANQEQRLISQYQAPIRELFKILDYKEQGAINRIDFVKAIRNEFSKKNHKLLSLPISLQQGSPTVNQVLEKILNDYRLSKQKGELEMISLNQFEEYFKASLPFEEIRLMQARIILAHFGPGSIASEGYYQKMKGRCLLEHEVIQQILEIFMGLDRNCELIIRKRDLISQIRDNLETDVIATFLPKIGKQYRLSDILYSIEQTIKEEEGHASNFISLQQLTDYLTNFIPQQPSQPPLFFETEDEQPPEGGEYLSMRINSLYLQILNDIFDMIPRVLAHYVLKEEFIATAKNDPQSKCLLYQIGRLDPATKKEQTINTVLNQIQQLPIDFIQWLDVLYMFSDKGTIKTDADFKLAEKPLNPPRGRKIYEQIVKGQQQEEEEHFEELENLSFDDLQMKKLKPAYEKMGRSSRSYNRITVPKEPKFRERKKQTIRQKRLEQMVKEIEEKEEFELNNKFKANPVPLYMFAPHHHENRFEKVQNEPPSAKPPTFYERDLRKFLERKQKAEDFQNTKEKQRQFKAKEVPIECTVDMLKQKEIADQQRRKELKEKRVDELIKNTSVPKRLLDDEQKRKEKKAQIAQLKPSDIDPECKFNPKLNKNFVPKGKGTKKGAEISYLDEDNQRNKRRPSADEVEEGQVDPQDQKAQSSASKQKTSEKKIPPKKVGEKVKEPEQGAGDEEQFEQNEQQAENEQLDLQEQEAAGREYDQEEFNQEQPEEQPQERSQKQSTGSKRKQEGSQGDRLEESQNRQDEQQRSQTRSQKPSEVSQKLDKTQNSQRTVNQQQDKLVSKPKTPQNGLGSEEQQGKKKPHQQQRQLQQNEQKQQGLGEAQAQPEEAGKGGRKERGKPMTSQELELQRIEEEKLKKKKAKDQAQTKLNPNYKANLAAMQDRVNNRPLLHTNKTHGSKNLSKYRQMAKEASMRQSEGNQVEEEEGQVKQENPVEKVGDNANEPVQDQGEAREPEDKQEGEQYDEDFDKDQEDG